MSARLEDLTRGSTVKGILPGQSVVVVDVKWFGSSGVEVTYKDSSGSVGNELLYRDREPSLEIVSAGRCWNFDADGETLRLVSEARRIRLAHLFDPLLAVHTSIVEPLPHQIEAVYAEMLPRQPLRFLLADDPGAGKTIMAGLLVKELIARGDLRRCLVCCPGNLTEQWQDEMYQRFNLDFEILGRQAFELARSGNPFLEKNLLVCRLDQISRNDEYQQKLSRSEWDLIISDEAHKMSATYYGKEVKETKRYKLGKLLGKCTRHFLLMTATPHNGREIDFQLFMALLDQDRYEGRYREDVHRGDSSDLMRRLIKEDMYRFDGTRLFPERWAYTVRYPLSDSEADLYAAVTEYVREEMNRADRLAQEGEGRRGNMIGFALTILQRRLASSPEAIWRSLERRIERLENRLREEKLQKRGAEARLDRTNDFRDMNEEEIDDFDDIPADEAEQLEEQLVDLASAARTIAELENEIETLRGLEGLARKVRFDGDDRKWAELSKLLQDQEKMFDEDGHRRKLVIFTEHKDTLTYLIDRIGSLVGKPEAIETIHGGMGREQRRNAQNRFIHDKDVMILVATDAAGEGINLQRAHLMVNYDLPWNPNRIEQRFGRIHRIGQKEVCHLWNLVAHETREGQVYERLLRKLETERAALGGQVFDVLGRVFQEESLRAMLLEAIRYGDSEDVKRRLTQKVESVMEHGRLQTLLEEKALVHDTMDARKIHEIREDMERAEARRLQPHYISSFFMNAFRLLGGAVYEREEDRFEVTHVPYEIRTRDMQIGTGERVLQRYERITFEKELINVEDLPTAAFICPGHPLLDATVELILERYQDLLKQGAVLVDPADPSETPRVLCYLEHEIQDGRVTESGARRVISKRLQFVERDEEGALRTGGYAPYLDYRPLREEERGACEELLEGEWLKGDFEQAVLDYAAERIVPEHLTEVREAAVKRIEKTAAAVKERLTKEIIFWDRRAVDLKEKELAGKQPRLNSGKARQRAEELQARLKKRMSELENEKMISPKPPVVVGGALIVPAGLLDRLTGKRGENNPPARFAKEKDRVEKAAMDAVLAKERELGYDPVDVSADKIGCDIESRVPGTGKIRFIEVKGRIRGAETVTVSRNEILHARNKPDDSILAVGLVAPCEEFGDEDAYSTVAEASTDYGPGNPVDLHYIRAPFTIEPDFTVTSVNFKLKELLAKAEEPS